MTDRTALAARVTEVTALFLLAPHVSEGRQSLRPEEMDQARMVFKVLQKHLTGRASEALKDLQQDPGSEDNRADLRKQLARLFDSEPAFAAEIGALVPIAVQPGDVVIRQVGAALSRGAQIAGSFSNVGTE